MKYCNNCGAKNSDDAPYCSTCGQAFEYEEPPQEYYDDQIHYDDPYGAYEEPVKKRSNTAIIIAVVLLVLLIIICAAIYFLYTQKKDTTHVTPKTTEANTDTPTGDNSGGQAGTSDSATPKSYTAETTGSWSISKDMQQLYTATASSTLPDANGLTYVPINVIDNNNRTAWTESKSGTGEGEWVALQNKSNETQTIHDIYFLNGYTKNQETFDMNTTPTRLEVSVGDSPSSAQKVADFNMILTISPQVVRLEKPITLKPGQYIKFTILETSIGPTDDVYDTNISEIYFD